MSRELPYNQFHNLEQPIHNTATRLSFFEEVSPRITRRIKLLIRTYPLFIIVDAVILAFSPTYLGLATAIFSIIHFSGIFAFAVLAYMRRIFKVYDAKISDRLDSTAYGLVQVMMSISLILILSILVFSTLISLVSFGGVDYYAPVIQIGLSALLVVFIIYPFITLYIGHKVKALSGPHAEKIQAALNLLKSKGLLIDPRKDDYVTAIMSAHGEPHAEGIASTIITLHELGLLAGEQGDGYATAIMSPGWGPYAIEINAAISLLHHAGLLMDARYIRVIMTSDYAPYAERIANDAIQLSETHLLKDEQGADYVLYVIEILGTLYSEKLFDDTDDGDQKYFDLTKRLLLSIERKHMLPFILQALKQLKEAQKLNEETFLTVVSNPLDAIPYLEKVGVTPDIESPVIRGYQDVLNFGLTCRHQSEHKHQPESKLNNLPPLPQDKAKLSNLPLSLRNNVMTFLGHAGDLQLQRQIEGYSKPDFKESLGTSPNSSS